MRTTPTQHCYEKKKKKKAAHILYANCFVFEREGQKQPVAVRLLVKTLSACLMTTCSPTPRTETMTPQTAVTPVSQSCCSR